MLESLVAARLPIAVVIVDRACRAESVARSARIPLERVLRPSVSGSFDRESFTDKVVAALTRHRVDLVAMAGYGTVLGSSVHKEYEGRVLNTHPSLLPAFKGWHAVEQALAAGVRETGCTVHVATLAVDEGPILAQETVTILRDDTAATLHERIKNVERVVYPVAIRAFVEACEGRSVARAAGLKREAPPR